MTSKTNESIASNYTTTTKKNYTTANNNTVIINTSCRLLLLLVVVLLLPVVVVSSIPSRSVCRPHILSVGGFILSVVNSLHTSVSLDKIPYSQLFLEVAPPTVCQVVNVITVEIKV